MASYHKNERRGICHKDHQTCGNEKCERRRDCRCEQKLHMKERVKGRYLVTEWTCNEGHLVAIEDAPLDVFEEVF